MDTLDKTKKKPNIAKIGKLMKEIGELTKKEKQKGMISHERDFDEIFEERILRDL